MKLPVQVTFRNVEPSEIVEEWIRAEAAKLETFYSKVMGCRVTVEMPHHHRRKGSLYHIRIDLTVPRGELVIKREPSLAARTRQMGGGEMKKDLEVNVPHKDLRLSINHAFKAAARRLKDYARRQRGDVKTHEALPVGHVSRLHEDEGYGFLTTDDGRELYFHQSSVLHHRFPRLQIGTRVNFVEEQGEKGPQASTVRIARSSGVRPAAHLTTISSA
jgi:cold shock CspA family protein